MTGDGRLTVAPLNRYILALVEAAARAQVGGRRQLLFSFPRLRIVARFSPGSMRLAIN